VGAAEPGPEQFVAKHLLHVTAGTSMMNMRQSSHRFLVKSWGIVAFFVVASIYSWLFGNGMSEQMEEQIIVEVTHGEMVQRRILNSLGQVDKVMDGIT
jgi:hypothetical protein